MSACHLFPFKWNPSASSFRLYLQIVRCQNLEIRESLDCRITFYISVFLLDMVSHHIFGLIFSCRFLLSSVVAAPQPKNTGCQTKIGSLDPKRRILLGFLLSLQRYRVKASEFRPFPTDVVFIKFVSVLLLSPCASPQGRVLSCRT